MLTTQQGPGQCRGACCREVSGGGRCKEDYEGGQQRGGLLLEPEKVCRKSGTHSENSGLPDEKQETEVQVCTSAFAQRVMKKVNLYVRLCMGAMQDATEMPALHNFDESDCLVECLHFSAAAFGSLS